MSDRLYVATRKGLFTFERGRGQWRIAARAFLGVSVTAVLPDPRSKVLHAAVKHGHFGSKLHRSTDHGRSFEASAIPKYPDKPESVDDREPYRNQPVPWSLIQLWCLEAGGADQPGRLWAGTIPGGLFRSDDDGASWSLVRSLWDHPDRKGWGGGGYDFAGIHSICVHPEDARRMSLAVSIGGVWQTEDDGETWRCEGKGMRAEYVPPELQENPGIQDPHRVVRCPAAPEVLWCQHHNGVFRSVDEGANWVEVTANLPSTFGFAVGVHPKDPATAWLVPADADERRIPKDGKVVVARTRDAGASFELLTRGLPQEEAYDLVYRHAFDVDATGDRLAMGSTGGSLWVSDDQGDGFEHVTAHLPPIYAVRFDPG